MTDEQIINALKCIADEDVILCAECAFDNVETAFRCKKNVTKAAIDFIKRQQEEIEILRNEINRQNAWIEKVGAVCEECRKLSQREHNKQMESLKDLEQKIPMAFRQVKEVSIREFAERLKERKYKSSGWLRGVHPYVVEEADIDEILEEMTEDKP